MITREMAKKITKEVIENQKKARETEAINFCEAEVSPLVEAKAKEGSNYLTINIPIDISIDLVQRYLQENGGFTANRLGTNGLALSWC